MKKLLAEFFGTFCLVFAGTGAIVIKDVSSGAVSHVGIALTFGLVVLVMIYAVGDVSGALARACGCITSFFQPLALPSRACEWRIVGCGWMPMYPRGGVLRSGSARLFRPNRRLEIQDQSVKRAAFCRLESSLRASS